MEQHNPLSDALYYAGIDNWSLLATTERDDRVLQPESLAMAAWSLKSITSVGMHAIVPVWETLVHTILPLNTANAWQTLGCYRIGNQKVDNAEKPVVVLLHIRAGVLSPADAQALVARISHEYYKLVGKESVPPTVPWKITVEAAVIRPCSDDLAIVIDGPPLYSQKTYPGSSIGHRGSDSSGSIGAFFEATLRGGKATKVLLTNHHVAVQSRTHEPFPPQWDLAAPADILSPSPQDLKATHEYVSASIDLFTATINRLEKKNHPGRLEDTRAALQSCQGALPTLAEDYTMWDIASLAQTSGWRSDEDGNQMDWGLAILKKDIPSPNQLPEWNLFREGGPRAYVIREFFDSLPQSITGISSTPLKAGDRVIKHGRSTGWTFGEVNTCAAYHFEWQAAVRNPEPSALPATTAGSATMVTLVP